MKYILSLFIAMNILVLNTSAQNHQEIESPTSDVLSLNSTGSSTTVLNFLNANAAPTGGSDKRAYISTNGNILNLGLSNNNTGGRIEFFGQGLRRMTMNADGRFGIGNIIPTQQLDVDGQVRIRNLPVGGATDQFLTADTNGNIKKKNAISFKACLDGKIEEVPFNSFVNYESYIEKFDNGDGFNPTTGIYTVPEDGVYIFHVKHRLKDPEAGSTVEAFFTSILNSNLKSEDEKKIYVHYPQFSAQHLSHQAMLELNQGQTIQVQIFSNTNNIKVLAGDEEESTCLSGYRIH